MSQVLLDTHTFVWWLQGSARLGARARAMLEDQATTCFVSAASVWELAIKHALGKLYLAPDLRTFVPEQLVANGFQSLAIEVVHATRVATLAQHHRDPFDRLLAAQALEEGLTLLSADRVFDKYGVDRVW